MKTLRLILMLFILPVCALAQGAQYTGVAQTARNMIGMGNVYVPIPGASVNVCTGVYTGTACPSGGNVTVYSNQALTTSLTQPLTADNYGNFTFWAAPGAYYFTVTGQGASASSYQLTLPFGISGTYNATAKSIEQVRYADQYGGSDLCAKIQAADADLGSLPGVIVSPPFTGTDVCSTQLVLSNPYHTIIFEGGGTLQLDGSGAGNAAIVIKASHVSLVAGSGSHPSIQMGPASEDDAIRVCDGTYTSSAQGPCSPVYGVKIDGLTIDGNQNATTGYGSDTFQNGININNCSRCVVNGNHVTNLWAQGIAFVGADGANSLFSVNTSGTSVTTGSGTFDTSGNWNGLPILINGVGYIISNVTSSTALTLTTSAGTQTSVTAFVPINSSNQITHNIVDHFGEIGIGGAESNVNYSDISHNQVYAWQKNATFSVPEGIVTGSGWQMYGNHYIGNTIWGIPTGTGIYTAGINYGTLIESNTIEQVAQCIAGGNQGANSNSVDWSAIGNTCRYATGYGISYIGHTDQGTKGITVATNSINHTGSYGIGLDYISVGSVTSNLVQNATGDGIAVSNSRHVLASDNHIDGASTGMAFFDSGGSVTSDNGALSTFCTNVSGACYSDNGTSSYDEYVDAGQKVHIGPTVFSGGTATVNQVANSIGLDVSGVSTSGESFGIRSLAGTTSADYSAELLNKAGTGGLTVRGDGVSVFSGAVNMNAGGAIASGQTVANSGTISGGTVNATTLQQGGAAVALTSQLPLSGSVAGSTTSLAANTCGDVVTQTVTGATTTMTPVVTVDGALPTPGLVIQSAVTAANTVSIEYCNVTTGSVVPAAATLEIRVIQ